MEKAIKPTRHNLPEGTIGWDCDYEQFIPIVEKMNELGAPIDIEDLIYIIENKLSGKKINIDKEQFLKYTFICKA